MDNKSVSSSNNLDTAVAQSSGGVELRNLTKLYNNEAVVNDVSAKVAPGEFFSLLGPSGSGKTTTLMMIAGFVSTDRGSIVVSGKDVAQQSPQQRAFGMVFQNYAIFPHLNVWENVAFPLCVRGIPKDEIKKRVSWALDLVRLSGFEERFSKQLSGGQQQRVALARAIVFHPKIVLMDEPLGALDKNLRYQMQTEIKDIQQRLGMTVVYVTHDQEEAMNMSDRMAIMNRGRIDQVATPSQVYDKPVNTFVAKFLGQANLLEGSLSEVSNELGTMKLSSGQTVRGAVRGTLAAGARVSLFMRPEKVSLSKTEPDLVTDNRLTGTVRRVLFLGNIVRYTVDAGLSDIVTVDVQNAGTIQAISVEDQVSMTWPVTDSLFLTDQP